MYKQAVKIGFGRDVQDGSHRKTTHPISTAAWRGRQRGLDGRLVGSHRETGSPQVQSSGPGTSCRLGEERGCVLKPRMDYGLQNAIILLTNKPYISLTRRLREETPSHARRQKRTVALTPAERRKVQESRRTSGRPNPEWSETKQLAWQREEK